MTTTTKRHNGFTRIGSRTHGATFLCDACGRRTRHTGNAALGSKLCDHCWDLAGLDNEINDGYATANEHKATILALTAAITKKGGHLNNWKALLADVEATSGITYVDVA